MHFMEHFSFPALSSKRLLIEIPRRRYTFQTGYISFTGVNHLFLKRQPRILTPVAESPFFAAALLHTAICCKLGRYIGYDGLSVSFCTRAAIVEM